MVELTAIVQTAAGIATGAGLTLTDAWQTLLGDRMAMWRLTNALKMQPKIEEELKRAGLKLNAAKVPDRYAFAWFEEATKQDENEIQDLFAKLLAQAAAGNNDALDRRLLDIVTRLTPDDAKVFKAIYDTLNWSYRRHVRSQLQSLAWRSIHTTATNVVGDRAQKSVEHLVTVGLLTERFGLNTREISGAISLAFRTNREPDVRNLQLKEEAQSTAIGTSLYLALYPSTIEQPTA